MHREERHGVRDSGRETAREVSLGSQSQDWGGKQNKDQTQEPFKQLLQADPPGKPPSAILYPRVICPWTCMMLGQFVSLIASHPFLSHCPYGSGFTFPGSTLVLPMSVQTFPRPSGTLFLWSANSERLSSSLSLLYLLLAMKSPLLLPEHLEVHLSN